MVMLKEPWVRKGLLLAVVVLDVTWCIFGEIHLQYENPNRICINCDGCNNCDECINCNKCTNCSGCFNCNGCANCAGCLNCFDCINCEGCTNCHKKNCVDIPYLNNGFTGGQCTPGIVGKDCNFWCHSGYHLNGNSTITCLEGGHWSSRPPLCTRISEQRTF